MRRLFTILMTASLLVAAGCGSSYEKRLEETLDRMRYEAKLDKNLMPPPKKEEGKFVESAIFIRPPKNFKHSKEFTLTVLEAGRFDLDASFLDEKVANESLHVLARINRPKAADKKKAAAPADAVVRGDFNADVVGVVNSAYSAELDVAKFKEETKKSGNKFKRAPAFESNGKNVQVFIYGTKNDQHQVALIFEYPKEEHTTMNPKIELCLDSFAVGKKAQRAYAGEDEEESGEEGGSGGSGVAF
jgi:hypothetical protein